MPAKLTLWGAAPKMLGAHGKDADEIVFENLPLKEESKMTKDAKGNEIPRRNPGLRFGKGVFGAEARSKDGKVAYTVTVIVKPRSESASEDSGETY